MGRRRVGSSPGGGNHACKGAGDAFDRLDPVRHQSPQMIQVPCFGAGDDVVGTGDWFCMDHPIEASKFLGDVPSFPYVGLDEDVSLNQGTSTDLKSCSGESYPGRSARFSLLCARSGATGSGRACAGPNRSAQVRRTGE